MPSGCNFKTDSPALLATLGNPDYGPAREPARPPTLSEMWAQDLEAEQEELAELELAAAAAAESDEDVALIGASASTVLPAMPTTAKGVSKASMLGVPPIGASTVPARGSRAPGYFVRPDAMQSL